MKSLSTLLGLSALASSCLAAEPSGNAEFVSKMPGLIAFWTFGEEAGQARASSGTSQTIPLQEVGGPIGRVEGGPFSGYSADLSGRQYFRIPYAMQMLHEAAGVERLER